MPGVSTKTIWPSGRWTMPWYVSRVVCGFGVTMAILVPTSAFNNVDLPTLVRPTSTARPDLKFGSVGCSTVPILPRSAEEHEVFAANHGRHAYDKACKTLSFLLCSGESATNCCQHDLEGKPG